MKDNKENKSFAMEILEDYKRINKVKDVLIFVLVGIIALFIGGLVYVVTNYDFSYEDTTTEAVTDTGNACIGDNCNNGEING